MVDSKDAPELITIGEFSHFTAEHLADLRKSGLFDETIAACFVTSHLDEQYVRCGLLNWKVGRRESLGPCLLFPYFGLDGEPIRWQRSHREENNGTCAPSPYIRVKPTTPRTVEKDDGKQHVVKYESPYGSKNEPYFPRLALDAIKDPIHLLVVTEGEKKALACCQQGIPCIGLSGVWNWTKKRQRNENGRGIGPRKMIDRLEQFPWRGRAVYVVFDSDADRNDNVQLAERCLRQALQKRGAIVTIVRLPSGPVGDDGKAAKVGLDDYLVAYGVDAFRGLMAKANEELPSQKIHLTDNGNARRVVGEYGHNIRFSHPWKLWFVWDDVRWKEDAVGLVMQLIKRTRDGLAAWAGQKIVAGVGGITKEEREQLEKVFKHCLRWEDARILSRCLDCIKSEPTIPIIPQQFDCDPLLLNVLNGTIDLRTGRLREHRRGDYITKLAPVDYNPESLCPEWDKCLNKWMGGNKNLIAYLQRVIGYSLTGSVIEQALWFLYGKGQNGKTTFLETICAFLGDYAWHAPSELLLQRHNEAHPTERADLFGRRFVTTIEVDDGKHIAESLMKQLTGGEKISARRMRQDFFRFDPTHKIFLAANHKPIVRGDDIANWRRIKLVPFTVTITESERDKHMAAKLIKELPGILQWAVKGCLDWQQKGIQEPLEVTQATADYKAEMDGIGRFITECCLIGNDVLSERSTVLHDAYCKHSGDKNMSQMAFSLRLEAKGFVKDRDGLGRAIFKAIGLVKQSGFSEEN